MVLALRPYRKVWLDTLKELGKSRMKEIRGLRAQVETPQRVARPPGGSSR